MNTLICVLEANGDLRFVTFTFCLQGVCTHYLWVFQAISHTSFVGMTTWVLGPSISLKVHAETNNGRGGGGGRWTSTDVRTWPHGEFDGVLEGLGAADGDDVGGAPPEAGDGTAAGIVQVEEVLVDAAMSTQLTKVTNPGGDERRKQGGSVLCCIIEIIRGV